MRTTIPTLKKEFIDGEIKRTKGALSVDIDTSFLAHLKWEEHFEKALGVSLTTYAERVSKWIKNNEATKENFLGLLKLLYCYVNSPELPTFTHFVKLFDIEIADEILENLKEVLAEVNNFASKN